MLWELNLQLFWVLYSHNQVSTVKSKALELEWLLTENWKQNETYLFNLFNSNSEIQFDEQQPESSDNDEKFTFLVKMSHSAAFNYRQRQLKIEIEMAKKGQRRLKTESSNNNQRKVPRSFQFWFLSFNHCPIVDDDSGEARKEEERRTEIINPQKSGLMRKVFNFHFTSLES